MLDDLLDVLRAVKSLEVDSSLKQEDVIPRLCAEGSKVKVEPRDIIELKR